LQEAVARAKENGNGFHRDVFREITLKNIHRNAGRMVTVAMRVQGMDKDAKFIYLRSAAAYRNDFSVLVPLEAVSRFAGFDGDDGFKLLVGKTIRVSGFLGVRNRRLELKLYYPSQLKINR